MNASRPEKTQSQQDVRWDGGQYGLSARPEAAEQQGTLIGDLAEQIGVRRKKHQEL